MRMLHACSILRALIQTPFANAKLQTPVMPEVSWFFPVQIMTPIKNVPEDQPYEQTLGV